MKTIIKNELTGKEIHLAEINDITKLRNQLMLLGINGLFYSPWAKDIREKIHNLEKIKENKER